jgi:hypothetical protein
MKNSMLITRTTIEKTILKNCLTFKLPVNLIKNFSQTELVNF